MRKNELATHLGQVPDCKKMSCPNQRRLTQIYCSIKAFCLHLLTMWQSFVNLPCVTVIAVTSSCLQDKGTTCSTAQETAGHCIYYNCNRSPNAKKIQGNNWTNTDSVTTNRGISDFSLLDIYDIWWSITQLTLKTGNVFSYSAHPPIYTHTRTHTHTDMITCCFQVYAFVEDWFLCSLAWQLNLVSFLLMYSDGQPWNPAVTSDKRHVISELFTKFHCVYFHFKEKKKKLSFAVYVLLMV